MHIPATSTAPIHCSTQVPDGRLPRRIGLTILLAALAGCAPRPLSENAGHKGPLTGDFALSDYFTASGFMGDGENRGPLLVSRDRQCSARWPGSVGSCFKFEYTASKLGWAGVYFQYPANNWGSVPGRAIADQYKRVRFLAAAEYSLVLPDGSSIGASCDATQVCRPGLSCEAGSCRASHSLTDGTHCLVSAECEPGLACSAQYCVKSQGGALGASCAGARSELCGDGLRCGEKDGNLVCLQDGSGDVGSQCATRNDCLSGLYCREMSTTEGSQCEPSTKLGPVRFMVGGIQATAANINYTDEIGVEYAPGPEAPEPFLRPDYQRFSLDLTDNQMSSLIGGFMWATAFPDVDLVRQAGPTAYLADLKKPAQLYFDDLVFEADLDLAQSAGGGK